MKKRIFPNHRKTEQFYLAIREWHKIHPEDEKVRSRVSEIRSSHRVQNDITDLARRISKEQFENIQKIRFSYLFDGSCKNLSNRECAVVERTKNQFRIRKKFQVSRAWKEKMLEE